MKPLIQSSYKQFVSYLARIVILALLLSPSTSAAQDDSGPYPVGPVSDGVEVLIEMEESAGVERPDKMEIQPLTADQQFDTFILPDPGPAIPQQLPMSILEPLPETPSDTQQPQALPDLIVVDIWSTTNPLQAGQEENVTFQIKNQGTAAITTQFLIRFSIDGTAKAAWSSGGLAVGQVAQAGTTVIVNSAGTHQMKIEVDFDNRIAESDESNNVREETWTWGTSPVDLIVDDIWSTTNPLQAGQIENLTYRIKNQGSAATTIPFEIHLWVDGNHIAGWTSAGLAAGAEAIGSFNALLLNSPGSHEIRVTVDTTDVVPESNEGNNSRLENWTWGASPTDLVVSDIWSATNPLRAGDVEDVTFSVKNIGTAGVPVNFHAQLWIDGTSSGFSLISGLAAGATATRSLTVNLAAPGLHEVKVIVDPGGAVPESNEVNNGRVEHWEWQPGPVDLVVDDIWSTTNPLYAGEVEDIRYRIENTGTADLPDNFQAQLWIDGLSAGTSSISGLAAGTWAIRSLDVTIATPGLHEVKVIVDPAGTVPETNEGNNVKIENWGWQEKPVDLVVEEIWSTTNPLETGKAEEIVYRIRNEGTADISVDFQAELWVDGVSAGTSLISGLAAGATATRSLEATVPVPGLHEVKVIVDPADVVLETNEGNNGRVENWEWVGEEAYLLFLPVILR